MRRVPIPFAMPRDDVPTPTPRAGFTSSAGRDWVLTNPLSSEVDRLCASGVHTPWGVVLPEELVGEFVNEVAATSLVSAAPCAASGWQITST